jgi:hypothetical protein
VLAGSLQPVDSSVVTSVVMSVVMSVVTAAATSLVRPLVAASTGSPARPRSASRRPLESRAASGACPAADDSFTANDYGACVADLPVKQGRSGLPA